MPPRGPSQGRRRTRSANRLSRRRATRRRVATTPSRPLSRPGAEESRGNALRSELADAANELTDLLGNQFALAQLKPLTPEQICWSILKVTGVYDRYLRAEEAELNKTKPLTGPAANDPALKRCPRDRARTAHLRQAQGKRAPFIAIYAAAPGQPQNDFFATADQALFAANGGSINSWIAPAGGNVSERMVQEKDLAQGRRGSLPDDPLPAADRRRIGRRRPRARRRGPRKSPRPCRSWSGAC